MHAVSQDSRRHNRGVLKSIRTLVTSHSARWALRWINYLKRNAGLASFAQSATMDSDAVYTIQIDKREAYEGRRRRSASMAPRAPAPGGPAWETGLFGFGDASWTHCFLALVLPCAIASNIEAMIDRSSYGVGAFFMGIAFLGEIVCATQSYQDGAVDHTAWTREYSDETLPISMWSLAAVICGIMYAAGVFAFRNMTRHYYRIPGSCCLDAVIAVCCSPCSMAQLSRHFKIAGPSVYADEALDTLPAYETST